MMEIQSTQKKEKIVQIPWVEKYRPAQLSDLISHQQIINTLKKFVKENSIPNLLFYGPPGTGKTSTIKALAKQIYKQDYNKMVLQLNASDQRGINVVRQQIKNFANSMTLTKTRNSKLIILDEADMMTSVAQFALRRIIQKTSNNARYCLISNYVTKVIPALQSRCTRFKFKQVSMDDCFPRIKQICERQSIDINDQGIESIYKLCGGDMRRVVNMTQSLSMKDFKKTIGLQEVYNFTGNPTPNTMQRLFHMITNQNVQTSYEKMQKFLKEMGISLDVVVKQFYQILLNMDLPNDQIAFLGIRLGQLEHRLSIGASEASVLGSLIGGFNQIKYLAS